MLRQQHISTIRQTHRVATTVLPVLTASLTVAGALIAAMESRNTGASSDAEDEAAEGMEHATDNSAARASGRGQRAQAARGVTPLSFLATLIGRALQVALGIALVLALLFAASATGRVGQAILLTALILLTLYLVEKAARYR